MATAELPAASPTPIPASMAPPPTPTVVSVLPSDWTLADLWTHLGGIPPERIRMFPPLGTATEENVLECRGTYGPSV